MINSAEQGGHESLENLDENKKIRETEKGLEAELKDRFKILEMRGKFSASSEMSPQNAYNHIATNLKAGLEILLNSEDEAFRKVGEQQATALEKFNNLSPQMIEWLKKKDLEEVKKSLKTTSDRSIDLAEALAKAEAEEWYV